jgi:hypothetical protein
MLIMGEDSVKNGLGGYWYSAEHVCVQDDLRQLDQRCHMAEKHLQPSLLAAEYGCVPTSWHSRVGLAGTISKSEGQAPTGSA